MNNTLFQLRGNLINNKNFFFSQGENSQSQNTDSIAVLGYYVDRPLLELLRRGKWPTTLPPHPQRDSRLRIARGSGPGGRGRLGHVLGTSRRRQGKVPRGSGQTRSSIFRQTAQPSSVHRHRYRPTTRRRCFFAHCLRKGEVGLIAFYYDI